MLSIKNKIILLLSLVEMLMFGAVSYGYNSLIPVYKKAGVFSQYCEATNETTSDMITCPTQDIYFGRVFLCWIIVQAILGFVIGIILDRYGIKVVKIISAIFVMSGFFCFAFTSYVNWLLYFAGTLLFVAGTGLAICNIQLSILVSEYQTLFVSIINSLIDSSGLVMTVIKLIIDAGIPFWITCISYGIFGFILIFGGMFLLKFRVTELISKKSIEENEIVKERIAAEDTIIKLEISPIDCIKNVKENYDNYIEKRFPTVISCILSPHFLLHFIFFAPIYFRFTFFLSQMTLQLEYLFQQNPEIVEHIQSISNMFFLGSLILCPIFGVIIDKIQQNTFQDLSSVKDISPKVIYNKITSSFVFPILICISSMIIASLMMCIANVYAFYAVLVFVVINRSIFFSINVSYLLLSFPKKFFGTIIGLIFLLANIINLLQQIIISFASKNSYPDIINYTLAGLCCLGIIHALYHAI